MAYKKKQDGINVLNTSVHTSPQQESGWRKTLENSKLGPEMKTLAMIERFDKTHGQIKVAPDTTGADYYFFQNFLTQEMEYEFWLIVDDFLKNCYDEIPEFARLGWSFPQEGHLQSIYSETRYRILNLILNGSRSGNTYCTELLKYLYKTYYKKEYNQLKRFRTINLFEIVDLADSDDRGIQPGNIARILTMCPLFDIELQERCGILYLFLDDIRKELDDFEDQEDAYLELDDELLQDCSDTVSAWVDEDMKNPKRQQQRAFWDTDQFLDNCFQYLGMTPDFLWTSGMTMNLGTVSWKTVLAILKKTFPKREFTYEEVQKYSHIFQLADAFSSLYEEHQNTILSLLGLHRQEFPDEYQGHLYFKPEAILGNAPLKQPAKVKVKKPVITNIAPITTSHASEEDYLTEISELRRKLHEQEQQNKNLQEEYQTTKKELKKAQTLLADYDQDRAELIALRNHVYQESQDAPTIPETDLTSMQKSIAQHDILIVGGHVNWHNRLKQYFPNWRYIDIHHYHNVDVKVVDGIEKVYFFTDYLSHITYRKMIDVVRDKNVPFGYVANVNMERFVKQVYEDIEG